VAPHPIGDVCAELRHGQEHDLLDRCEELIWLDLPAIREQRGVLPFEVEQQLADVEAPGGVSHERDSVTGFDFATGDSFREVVAQPAGPRLHACRGQVVEAMQHDPICLPGVLPAPELRSSPGIVFNLAQRVEACESRNHDDVHTTIGRIPLVHGGRLPMGAAEAQ
jgi:hypothetical protein